ncbi:MAG: trimethylamine methyltransferase family protein [Kiritimatiellae bacterium]|nr:trimethylamine methyltransferase family protein [Kiritimatiellia bacterium]
MTEGVIGGRYQPLTQDQIGRIHESALRILEEIGVQVALAEAQAVFAQAGARVDAGARRVRIPARLVEKSLGLAPSRIVLCGREPRHDLALEDSRVYMGTGGAALNVLDPDTGAARPGKLRDIAQLARLVDGLENVHFFIRPCTAQDVPRERLGVTEFHAAISNTTKHVMGAGYTLEGVRQVIDMAGRVAGDVRALRKRPFISFTTGWMVSPLTFDPDATRALMEILKRRIPVALSSAPMAGSTAPITMAGTLAQLHAEELAGIVFSQLVKPGAPVLYGGIPGMADMHDLSYKAGGVEFGLMNAAISQLAGYIRVPNYCSAGITEARIPDMQAIYEKTFSIVQCALAGANYVHHAAGILDSILTVDYGQFVIDNEIIGMALKMVRGIRVDEEHLALETIAEVGPGGNFVSTEHTLAHLRTEFLEPMLVPRHVRAAPEALQMHQPPDILAGARERAKRIIREHEVPGIPRALDREIRETYGLGRQEG